jgi:lysophospholipase L1-like esterase
MTAAQLEALQQLYSDSQVWGDQLGAVEGELDEIERALDAKEHEMDDADRHLAVIEDRQRRFQRLIELFEQTAPDAFQAPTKQELLGLAKRLYQQIADYDKEIESLGSPRTLTDLLFLLSDAHARFRQIHSAAAERRFIHDPTLPPDGVPELTEEEEPGFLVGEIQ